MVTDREVDAARGVILNYCRFVTKAEMREALESAAAAQAEPEIPVTAEMLAAGKIAFERDTRGGGKTLRNVYTAMRKLEPAPRVAEPYTTVRVYERHGHMAGFGKFVQNERSGKDRREVQKHDCEYSRDCCCSGRDRRKSDRRAP